MGNNQSDEEIAEVYKREVSSEDARPPPQLVAEANKRPRLSSNPHEYSPHISSQHASETTLTLKNPGEGEDDTINTNRNSAVEPQVTTATQSRLRVFTTQFVEAFKKPTPSREYDRVEEDVSAMSEETPSVAAVPATPSFASRFVQALKKPTPMREYDSPDRGVAIINGASAKSIPAQSELLPNSPQKQAAMEQPRP